MSAETLRKAAALMRERAEAADTGHPWSAFRYIVAGGPPESTMGDVASTWPDTSGATAAHIASWHPTVALAVADWLDAEALRTYSDHERCEASDCPKRAALEVARTYLGGDA